MRSNDVRNRAIVREYYSLIRHPAMDDESMRIMELLQESVKEKITDKGLALTGPDDRRLSNIFAHVKKSVDRRHNHKPFVSIHENPRGRIHFPPHGHGQE